MKHARGNALAAIFLAAVAASGCGLKGALTLPSKSDEVVIRAPGQTAPAEGETTGHAICHHTCGTSPGNPGQAQGRAHPAAAAAGRQTRHRPRWLMHAHWCSWMARPTCTGPSTRCRR